MLVVMDWLPAWVPPALEGRPGGARSLGAQDFWENLANKGGISVVSPANEAFGSRLSCDLRFWRKILRKHNKNYMCRSLNVRAFYFLPGAGGDQSRCLH